MVSDTSRIIDFISGESVLATQEEVDAVQVFSKILVEDYNYPKNHIQTRPQYKVKVRPSDNNKSYPIDIGIFSSENRTDDNLEIIVECKQPDKKDGISQLKNYLTLSKAYLGVWFNGNDKVFIRKTEKNGKVIFDEIINIPKYGERLEDIGQFKKSDLIVPKNLTSIFKSIKSHLAGNAVGVTRDETLAQQIINMIFCKIYDEKFTKHDEKVTFRAGIDESEEEIAKRIKQLFERIKTKYKMVIGQNEELSLDNKSIAYVVGELQSYSLMEAERDAIADSFELFVGNALKGTQGQFFTPRNVVQLMVSLINPATDDIIIDPACGSGGFLVESLRHFWRDLDSKAKEFNWSELDLQEEKIAVATKSIFGIEKDSFLSKVAKSYMVILGDGQSGIFCEDSLDNPKEWNSKTQQSIELGKFDALLTNPPFGKNIKVTGKDKLMQYTLRNENDMNPEIAFIERGLHLLKDGGIMGIVLSETIFHAPRKRRILDFISNHNIKWLIDLPHNTFRPHNNAKCILLVLQKNMPQEEKINFAVALEMGHDHLGRIMYRWDSEKQKAKHDEVWDDIQEIILELENKKKTEYTFSVEKEKVQETGILVPRYYWRTTDRLLTSRAKKEKAELVELSSLIEDGSLNYFDGHGSPKAEYKGKGEFPYIRVKDIVNWEIYKNPTASIPEHVYKDLCSDNKALMENDILFVRRGSYRIGSVAMLSKYDTEIALTREILVLRLNKENRYNLTPEYLLYQLSHNMVSMQMYNKVFIDTTLPNIANRWKELKIPLFTNKSKVEEIKNNMKEIVDAKKKSKELLEKIKKMGDITT